MQLKASAANTTLATNNLTVISVTLALRVGGSVSSDNAGLTTYFNLLGTTNLGTFLSTGQTAAHAWRTAVEIVGTVQPSGFSSTIIINREVIQFMRYGDNNNLAESGGPFGDTTSIFLLRDDNPQSGTSQGKVYDLDAPALGTVASQPVGYIQRIRTNFRQWATVNGVQVSGEIKWFARISVIKGANGDQRLDNIANDNLAEEGTTKLTWNLQ